MSPGSVNLFVSFVLLSLKFDHLNDSAECLKLFRVRLFWENQEKSLPDAVYLFFLRTTTKQNPHVYTAKLELKI